MQNNIKISKKPEPMSSGLNFRLRDNQPGIRKKAEQVLSHSLNAPPDAEECSAYGDRTEIRQIWAQEVTAESVGDCTQPRRYLRFNDRSCR